MSPFEESELCKGCEYCLSGKYIHPMGLKYAVKKIVGKEEGLIILFGIIGGLLLVGLVVLIGSFLITK